MIKAVLFDFGGVLSPGGKLGSVRRMLARTLGIDESEVQRMDEPHRLLMTGQMDDQAFLRELSARHPGSKQPSIEALLQNTDVIARSDVVYDLAEMLRSQGIRTGILSNMFSFGAQVMKRQGLFEGFDPVLLSYETHLMKPDPAFYQLALERLGLPADQVLFVDDRTTMLAPATKLGMQTLLAISPEQIVTDIQTVFARENNLRLV